MGHFEDPEIIIVFLDLTRIPWTGNPNLKDTPYRYKMFEVIQLLEWYSVICVLVNDCHTIYILIAAFGTGLCLLMLYNTVLILLLYVTDVLVYWYCYSMLRMIWCTDTVILCYGCSGLWNKIKRRHLILCTWRVSVFSFKFKKLESQIILKVFCGKENQRITKFTNHHDITEILLKVALSTINQTKIRYDHRLHWFT
jgi:hypothetical protein